MQKLEKKTGYNQLPRQFLPLLFLQVALIPVGLVLNACSPTTPAILSDKPKEPELANYATSSSPLYNINRAIPGELIVRFKSETVDRLLVDLQNPLTYFGQPDSLIGRRINGAVLRQAAPELTNLFERYKVEAGDAIDPSLGIYRLKAAATAEPALLLRDFKASQQLIYVEPNFPVHLFKAPNDQFYRAGNQWGLRAINAPDAWDITTGSEDIMIAILDTGVAAAHPDLDGKVLAGLNFTIEPPTISTIDDQGHGTFVAGIAAAKSNNGTGVAGVAWGAQILPVKVLSASGNGSNATIAMGINFATERKANIINLSLGTEDRSQAVADAVTKAYQAGIVLVAAVGNEGSDKPQYPATFDEVIAVGATNTQDKIADFTNAGPEVALSAPGTGILSLTWAQNGGELYAYDSGTSFSSPYVAGVVALMLSVNKSLTNAQVRQILENTVDIPAGVLPTPSVSVSGLGSIENGTITPRQTVTANSTTTPRQSITANGTVTPRPTATSTPLGLAYTPVASPDAATPVATIVNTPTAAPSQPTVSTTPIGGGTLSNIPFYDQRLGWGRLNALKAVQAAQNRETFTSRRAQLSGKVVGYVETGDVIVTLSPGDVRIPDSKGSFSYTNLPPGIYRLTVSVPKYGLPNATFPLTTYAFRILGKENETFQWQFDIAKEIAAVQKNSPPLPPFASLQSAPNPQTDLFFPETGHSISGIFRQWWERFGGVDVFGYPISEEFVENGVTVQYFERMIFESQPNFARTRFAVQPRMLGRYYARTRPEAAFKPVPAPTPEQLAKEPIYYWAESQHTLRGQFLKYWAGNNGLLTFGYPISEPLVENDRLVQYFERYRLELHPENEGTPYEVLGTLMARNFAIERKYINP